MVALCPICACYSALTYQYVQKGSVLLFAAVLIDKDRHDAAKQVAMGQHRKAEINTLLEKNNAIMAEREKQGAKRLMLQGKNRK